jgi:hypothetical protein
MQGRARGKPPARPATPARRAARTHGRSSRRRWCAAIARWRWRPTRRRERVQPEPSPAPGAGNREKDPRRVGSGKKRRGSFPDRKAEPGVNSGAASQDICSGTTTAKSQGGGPTFPLALGGYPRSALSKSAVGVGNCLHRPCPNPLLKIASLADGS